MTDTSALEGVSPPLRVVLNDTVFRARTRALGAQTDRERCAVAGISKASLHRWRKGSVTPSLDSLRVVAARLGVGINDLIREEAA